MTESHRDEFALINYLTEKSQVPAPLGLRIPIGNGDDAAVVKGRHGYDWVVCCDTMVEAIHFKRETMNPYDIGYKALASNISDIAAMGGIPLFYLVSIAISPNWTEDELAEMYRGMNELAQSHSMALIGGDTVSSPVSLTITVTVLGEVEEGRQLTRGNAQAGDLIFITGTPGDSGAGLDVLLQSLSGIKEYKDFSPLNRQLIDRHCRPTPQVKAGRILAESGFRVALNDISDGLASESWEIAKASGVRICLEEERIPLSKAIEAYGETRHSSPLNWAYYGGEDYLLIGSVPATGKVEMDRSFQAAGLPLYWIGKVELGEPGVVVKKEDGTFEPLMKKGYNHFQRDEVDSPVEKRGNVNE